MSSQANKALSDPEFAVVRRHQGRSTIEGLKIITILTLAHALIIVIAIFALPTWGWTIGVVAGLAWIVSCSFVAYFFRDASPVPPPPQSGAILSPSHGTIDYIDECAENQFLNGRGRRISIYLSLLNVHVQHAPVSGNVACLQHFPGRWSRAKRRDSSVNNEHLLVGFVADDKRPILVRMISGLWVRRIVPWIARDQQVIRGERIGLIRFGSRVDVFLPLTAHIKVKPGDRVRGGETVLAHFEE